MKNRGFTLIELLAVIVILAIIALIATPIVLDIINDTREESNKRSMDLYARSVQQATARYALKNSTNDLAYGEFTISADGKKIINSKGQELEVEYDGPIIKCEKVEIKIDGSIKLKKCQIDGVGNYYNYGVEDENGSEEPSEKVCTISNFGELVSDVQMKPTEIVTCGEEEFYVIDNDGNTITMLAQYGLNTDVTPYKQSSNNAGPMNFLESTPEVLPQSDTYIYFNYDNNLKIYVESYENYLINTVGMTEISARLASLEDLKKLGLSAWDIIPENFSWLYSINFWLGTSSTMDNYSNYMYLIYYDPYINGIGGGVVNYNSPYSDFVPGISDSYIYIRPVIEMSVNQINN